MVQNTCLWGVGVRGKERIGPEDCSFFVSNLVVSLTFKLYSFVTLIKQKFRKKIKTGNLMYKKYLGSFSKMSLIIILQVLAYKVKDSLAPSFY